MIDFASPVSHDSSNSDSVFVSLLIRDYKSSVISRSDGSGSLVEDEPLLDALWVVVSNSESVLISTNMLMSEESSVLFH